MATVSIVLTAHNSDLFFKRAVTSIERQTRRPHEVIVVLEGSEKQHRNSMWVQDIPKEWRVYWTEKEFCNPATLRNVGMYYATGEWILLLDGDSFLVPSCLEAYAKILPTTHVDVVTEFMESVFIHNNFKVTKNIPDKEGWQEIVKFGVRTIYAGSWKKGELPIKPLFIRNEKKKYFPLDYNYLEDKMLILSYIMEERRVLLSDYCSVIRNIFPPGISRFKNAWDEVRYKKLAANIHVNGWTFREKIFEEWKSYEYLTDIDQAFIDKSASFLTVM